ncbi:MAG: hypothetical protein R2748_32340 [Bryobacterales bacterium]
MIELSDTALALAIAALALSAVSLAVSIVALRRAGRAVAQLAEERVARLSAVGAAETQARLTAGRLEAIEQRVGKANRVTPAKRNRAIELLAAGANESAIARELGLREAEVAALAALQS